MRPSSASTTERKSGASTPVPSWRQATYRNSSGGACIASAGEWWNEAGLSDPCCMETPFGRAFSFFEQGCDQLRRPLGAVGLDGLVVDLRAEPLEHQAREPLRRRLVVRRRLGRAVAAQAVDDVVVLLEVVAQRDRDERAVVRAEHH